MNWRNSDPVVSLCNRKGLPLEVRQSFLIANYKPAACFMKKIMTSADPFMKLIADMDKPTRNTILHSF